MDKLSLYEKYIRYYENSIFLDRSISNLFDYAFFLLRNEDFEKSESLFEEVIELVNDGYYNDKVAQMYKAASLANISNIFRRTGFFTDSLIKRNEALELQSKFYEKGHREIILSKFNLALIHSKLMDYEKALYYIVETSNEFDRYLSREEINLEFNKGHILNGRGILSAEANNLHEAAEWFIKAFEYRKTIKTEDKGLDFCLISESAYNAAKTFYNLQNYDKAKLFVLIAENEIKKAICIDSHRFMNDKKRIEILLVKLEEI